MTNEMMKGLKELGGLVADYTNQHLREIYNEETACLVTCGVSFDGSTYFVKESCDIEPAVFFAGSLAAAKAFLKKYIASGELLDPDEF